MDPRSVRPGELVAALSGVVLLVVMAMDWYGVSGGAGLDAWRAFDVLDVALALLAAAALALAILNAVRRSPGLPVAAAVLTLSLAALLALAVAYRLLDEPGPDARVAVEPGAYLGVVAVVGIFLGAGRSLRDEAPRRTPAPHVTLRPAPAPAPAPVHATEPPAAGRPA